MPIKIMNNYKIRQAIPADAPAIRTLVHKVIDDCYTGKYHPECLTFMKDHHNVENITRDITESYTVVFENQNGIFATGCLQNSYIICRLFISAAVQKGGYGRKLMSTLEEKAKENNTTKIILASHTVSTGFYHKLNYTIYTTGSVYLPNSLLAFYRMTKEI